MRREIFHKCNNICVVYRAMSDLKTVSCRFVYNESNREKPTSLSLSVIEKKIEKTKVKKLIYPVFFEINQNNFVGLFLIALVKEAVNLSRTAVEKRIIILQFQKW
jgi:hypothetical protein